MRVKFAPNLFLEVAELKRLQDSLDSEGFRKILGQSSQKYGLIRNSSTDFNFDNAKVSRDTDLGADKTIKINELFGIDDSSELLYSPEQNQIVVPNDGSWYWVKVSHVFSTQEKGLFSLAANGDLSGDADAELLTILRGQPNFPSRVKFLNSVYNTQEYDILEVIDDQSAVVSGGPFTVESDLKLAVVGTFTPGITVPTGDKYPFQYDSVTTTLVVETSLNQRPTFTQDSDFYLARVKRVGADVVIQDKRTDWYKTKSSDDTSIIDSVINPTIGIESIRYNQINTPRDRNIVDVCWGYRSSNYTITSSSNLLSLSSGEGGRFETNAQFTDGDFDGWRVYTPDGKYAIITSSIKQASNINLTLDMLDLDSYSTDGGTTWLSQEVFIAPNCEEIELRFTPTTETNLVTVNKTFPINTRLAKIELVAFDTLCAYVLEYRYKTLNTYSEFQFPQDDDTPYGFLSEYSFDDAGVYVPLLEARDTTISGQFNLHAPLNAYKYFYINKEGVEYFTPNLGSSNEITHLTVKENTRFQVLGGQNTLYGLTLTRDYYIDLKTDNASNGSEFFISVKMALVYGNYSINFQEGYVNSGSRGTTLFTLDKFWSEKTRDKTILLHCKYDGTYWYVVPIIGLSKLDTNIKGENIRTNSTSLTTAP